MSELKLKIEVDPPSDLEEPEWCAAVRELLKEDQAPKALKAADRGLREAVKRKDKGREARARQMQVYVLLQLPKEDPMDIIEVVKTAVAALEDCGDWSGYFWSVRVQALLLAELLFFDEAIDLTNLMLARARERSESSSEALAQLTTAEVCRMSSERAERGLAAAQQALSLFLRSGDRGGQGAAHQALSDLHRLENDLEQAFQAAATSLKYFQAESARCYVSREIGGLAGAYYRQALALELQEVEALRLAERAVKVSGRADWEAQALALLAHTKLRVCGKSEGEEINHGILKLAQLAVEHLQRHRPFHRTLLAQGLSTLSDALLRSGAQHSALASAKEAQRLYRKAGMDLAAAKAQLQLAEAEVGLGRAEQAREDLLEAFDVFKSHEYFDGQDVAMDLLDTAHKALGLPTRAELAEKKRQERQKQQQLLAQQYWQQQQQQQQGGQPMPPQLQMPLSGEDSLVKPKNEKVELNREANPLDMKAGMDVATIKSKITSVAAVIMGGEDDFEADTPLMEAGLTSNTAVMLRDELTKDLPGIKLPMTLSFDYPSVQAITDFVLDQSSKMIAG